MNTLSACVSMLQPERSATYVLATNHIEPVRNFVTMAFDPADIELAWDCEDEQEIAVDRATGVAARARQSEVISSRRSRCVDRQSQTSASRAGLACRDFA